MTVEIEQSLYQLGKDIERTLRAKTDTHVSVIIHVRFMNENLEKQVEIARKCLYAVCDYLRVPYNQALSSSRKRPYVEARSITSYLLVKEFQFKPKAVAKCMKRDRTTILDNIQNIADLLTCDQGIQTNVAICQPIIQQVINNN